MIAARLRVPVIPVRIEGLDRILHQSWRMAKPGPARVAFGKPLRLEGEDYRGPGRSGRGSRPVPLTPYLVRHETSK